MLLLLLQQESQASCRETKADREGGIFIEDCSSKSFFAESAGKAGFLMY
jgi:hypothetical protein